MAEVTQDRKLVAEFLGTAALVLCGPGTATATFVLISGNAAAKTPTPFDMSHLGIISFAFMMVILAIIYAIGHISGCHINPAVTLALAATKKMPWSEVPGYMIAQFAGGIAGAYAIWGILGKAGLKATNLGQLSYANGNAGHAFFTEFIGTMFLLFVVFGTAVDGRATPGWYGFAIPAYVFAIITVGAPVTGVAINPARYIGPMIAAATLKGHNSVLWHQAPVYFIAIFLGGLVGAFIYSYVGATKPEQVAAAEPERVAV
jgi:glycerol uptake facilitator protein